MAAGAAHPSGRSKGAQAADGGFISKNGIATICEEVTIAETTGAGTYSGSVDIPAGATILDVKIRNTAAWTATTSATLIAGDTEDPNGFYDAINLKATDLVVGEELNFENLGGKPGVYLVAATGHRDVYRPSATKVTVEVITVGAAGNAGRTRMLVIYAAPAAIVRAATKV